MRYFGLIWKNLWRKKIRTTLTVLSVMIAFLLFAMLSAIGYAFKGGVDAAAVDRLVVIDKVSLINPLPISYLPRIASVTGVAAVTHATWFGGYYQDTRNQFAQFPVEPKAYFAMYPELNLPPDQLDAWSKDRSGAVVSADLAKKYGWNVGDRIPIQATIWTKADGGRTWEFTLDGIFSSNDARANATMLLFQYDYFEEARKFGKGTVGWYILRVAKGADAVNLAHAVDDQFENSPHETKTSTEKAFAQSFIKQFGNIALIVRLVLGAVFFTLLLVAGNTMAQSVRERIPELAVLKTVGFSDKTVLGIVLAESILIMLFGGLLGLALGWLAVHGLVQVAGTFLPGMYLSPQTALFGVALMVSAGIAAGIFPALSAMRLSIIDALARR